MSPAYREPCHGHFAGCLADSETAGVVQVVGLHRGDDGELEIAPRAGLALGGAEAAERGHLLRDLRGLVRPTLVAADQVVAVEPSRW